MRVSRLSFGNMLVLLTLGNREAESAVYVVIGTSIAEHVDAVVTDEV